MDLAQQENKTYDGVISNKSKQYPKEWKDDIDILKEKWRREANAAKQESDKYTKRE